MARYSGHAQDVFESLTARRGKIVAKLYAVREDLQAQADAALKLQHAVEHAIRETGNWKWLADHGFITETEARFMYQLEED